MPSSAQIIKRVEKCAEHLQGCVEVNHVAGDELAVLFLGGDMTDNAQAANGYLSAVDNFFKEENINCKVGLYAPVYNFGNIGRYEGRCEQALARCILMHKHKHYVDFYDPANHDLLNPTYVDDIFNKVILPRIADNNKRLTFAQAQSNIRKLNVVVHCHGAYTFVMLEDKMQQQMEQLGYDRQERNDIQKQLFCVAHSPDCPLGALKSTMISFAYFADTELNHYNYFEDGIRQLVREKSPLLKLSYFPNNHGNIILSPSMGNFDQHAFVGFFTNAEGLNRNGQIVVFYEGEALKNAVVSAAKGEMLPDMPTLLCGKDAQSKKFLAEMQNNGDALWQELTIRMFNKMNKLKTENKNR